ncbi:hypothetical protein D3C81_1424370 [compost metagenome]
MATLDVPILPVLTGIPSMTIKGYELRDIEFRPRTRITGGLLSNPFGKDILTPEALPARAWSKLCTGISLIASAEIVDAAPVKSFRF